MNRFRRLRSTEGMRKLVRETFLNPSDFTYPIFVTEGENIKEPVPSMPNVFRYSINQLDEILKEVDESKISGILIFGIPKEKDEEGSGAYAGMALPSVQFVILIQIPLHADYC